MRVKIGSIWYSADDQPLAVQFTAEELAFIQAQDPATWPNRTFAAGNIPSPMEGELDQLVTWLREGR